MAAFSLFILTVKQRRGFLASLHLPYGPRGWSTIGLPLGKNPPSRYDMLYKMKKETTLWLIDT
jgi:hypothetical protein